MIAAFIILTSLIALLPALMMVDGILASGIVSAICRDRNAGGGARAEHQ
jgi:hypothetical protein